MDKAVVVIDTRERTAYTFDQERTATVRCKLCAGDYSLAGFERMVAVERKTLDDLVSTVIHARDRFRRELERLAQYEAACIVVEGNLRDVLDRCYRSAAHPNAIVGNIVSIVVRFGIPVYFCSDREAANRFVEAYLLRIHRKISERALVVRKEA